MMKKRKDNQHFCVGTETRSVIPLYFSVNRDQHRKSENTNFYFYNMWLDNLRKTITAEGPSHRHK